MQKHDEKVDYDKIAHVCNHTGVYYKIARMSRTKYTNGQHVNRFGRIFMLNACSIGKFNRLDFDERTKPIRESGAGVMIVVTTCIRFVFVR